MVMDVRCPKCGAQVIFQPHPTLANRVQGFCECNNGPVIELTLDTSAIGDPDEQQGDESL
jgi:hypothetical protein